MKKNKFFEGKTKAQAMVEFAIALPVLLLILYGVIEAGRLLFLYSTVVTASRQAVRYGSATGVNNNNIPRYNDCQGIRDAATAVGYLGAFDSIDIDYDTGPGTVPNQSYCPDGTPTDSTLNKTILETNRARLIVTVHETFRPLVKLVPFFQREISATSARTILYSVAIVVDQQQQEWFKTPTTLTITADTPDPSEVNQSVTVSVLLVDGDNNPVPNALVEISGADVNCQITTNNNGIGSCPVIFSTPSAPGNPKIITAIYNGDADYLGYSVNEEHTVTLIQTETKIISHNPNPSVRNQQFVVIVEVIGSQTPTGTVNIDGGQGVKCTITLANGTGNCPLNYNNAGDKTLTATYVPDNGIFDPGVAVSVIHSVIDFTPTPTNTATATIVPTATLKPTATPIPSNTPSPTLTATAVLACNAVSHTPISLTGGVMSMTISNPYPFPLVMKDITVTWNDDKGHNVGNKQLFLTQILVGPTVIWTGEIDKASTYTVPTSAVIPAGTTSAITFVFHQSYDNQDGTEQIYINLATPGCENNPINSKQP